MPSIPGLFFYSTLPLLMACSNPATSDKALSRLVSVTAQSLSTEFENNENIRHPLPAVKEREPLCRQDEQTFYRQLDSLPFANDEINNLIAIVLHEHQRLDLRLKKEDIGLSLFSDIPELKTLELKMFLSDRLTTASHHCSGCGSAFDNVPLQYEIRLEKDSSNYFSLYGAVYLALRRGEIRIKNAAGKRIDLSKTTFMAPDRVYPLHNRLLYAENGRSDETVKSIELVLYDPISGRERIYPTQPK